MRDLRIFVTIVSLLGAVPASAHEVQLGFRTEAEYDAELTEGEADGIFRMGPVLSLSGELRRFSYGIVHDSVFEKYARNERLNDWEHRTSFQGSWVVGPRLTIRVRDSFSRLSSIRSSERDLFDETFLEAEGDFITDSVTTNNFSADFEGTLTPRLGTLSSISHFLRDPENPSQGRGIASSARGQQEVSSTTLVNQLYYQITEAHRTGLGFRYRHLEAETLDFERTTETYEVFATWNWTIDARTQFNLQVGPAISEDDPQDVDFPRFGALPQDPLAFANPGTCPLQILPNENGVNELFAVLTRECSAIVQPDLTESQLAQLEDSSAMFRFDRGDPESGTNVSPFFSLELSRQWARGSAFVNWSRTDSQVQSTGSDTVLNTFRIGARYRPASRWSTSVTFRFSRRTTETDRELPFPLLSFAADPNALGTGLTAFPIVGTANFDQKLKVDSDFFDLEFRTSREVGRHSNVFAVMRLRRTTSDVSSKFEDSDTVTDESAENTWRFQVGFNYRFRPIRY